jgi:predicted nucleic acid-binding protein
MNGETVKEFVDSNVLIYAFDPSAQSKQVIAAQLLQRLSKNGNGCISVQVLQEFFVTITRKVSAPLAIDEAGDLVRDFSTWKVFAPSSEDVLAAIAVHKQAKISFWDAMVVHAASELGCERLWSEDLKPDAILRGVRICNPFLKSGAKL